MIWGGPRIIRHGRGRKGCSFMLLCSCSSIELFLFPQAVTKIIHQGRGQGHESRIMEGPGIIRRGSERYSAGLFLSSDLSRAIPLIIRLGRGRGCRRGSDTDLGIIRRESRRYCVRCRIHCALSCNVPRIIRQGCGNGCCRSKTSPGIIFQGSGKS